VKAVKINISEFQLLYPKYHSHISVHNIRVCV